MDALQLESAARYYTLARSQMQCGVTRRPYTGAQASEWNMPHTVCAPEEARCLGSAHPPAPACRECMRIRCGCTCHNTPPLIHLLAGWHYVACPQSHSYSPDAATPCRPPPSPYYRHATITTPQFQLTDGVEAVGDAVPRLISLPHSFPRIHNAFTCVAWAIGLLLPHPSPYQLREAT